MNFCKFTNETRIEIENANHKSNLKYLCVIEGACAGGGYELALKLAMRLSWSTMAPVQCLYPNYLY